MAHDELPPKAALVTEDCFAAVIRAFMSPANPRWMGKYAQATRDLWGRELRLAARPDCLGAVSLQMIRPALVQAHLDGLSETPAKQNAAYSALKALEAWAIVRDILPRQITLGVETEDMEDGHYPWDDAHVVLAEKHARPDLARAVTLGANTGQRGSDLVRIGPTFIENFKGIDGFRLVQRKTGREVWVPILSALTAHMGKWEHRPGPYLTRLDGRPWTRKALTNAWLHERDTNPALAPLRAAGPEGKKLVLHGLRGHACVRLLRAGANTSQISDMVGMSQPMVIRYTRFSSQQENAAAAVINLERTIRERQGDMSNKTGS